MKDLWSIVRTDFIREFSSRSTLIFFLLLPMIFTATLAGQLDSGNSGGPNPDTYAVPLEVVQEDSGLLGPAMIRALEANNLLVKPVAALAADSVGVVIPAGFSERLLAGEPVTLTLQVSGNDSNTPALQQAVESARERLWITAQAVRAGVSEAEARKAFPDAAARETFTEAFLIQVVTLAQDPPARSVITWAGAEEGALRIHVSDAEQASAGQLVTWVQVTLLGTSAILINEQLSGTLRRLLIMPIQGWVILGGKLTARLLMGLMQMALLFVGGALLFGVPWGRSPLGVALVSVAFALAIAGLGLVVATIVKTPVQAGLANTGLAMTLAAMGGAWWPLEITPAYYQQAMQILPTTWAMRAYTRILLQGVDVADLTLEIGVLLGFAVLFFIIGLIRFRQFRV